MPPCACATLQLDEQRRSLLDGFDASRWAPPTEALAAVMRSLHHDDPAASSSVGGNAADALGKRLVDALPNLGTAGAEGHADASELMRRVAAEGGLASFDAARRGLKKASADNGERHALLVRRLEQLVATRTTAVERRAAMRDTARTLGVPETASEGERHEAIAWMLLRGAEREQ